MKIPTTKPSPLSDRRPLLAYAAVATTLTVCPIVIADIARAQPISTAECAVRSRIFSPATGRTVEVRSCYLLGVEVASTTTTSEG